MYQSKKNVQKQISNTHVKKNTDEKVLSKIKDKLPRLKNVKNVEIN